ASSDHRASVVAPSPAVKHLTTCSARGDNPGARVVNTGRGLSRPTHDCGGAGRLTPRWADAVELVESRLPTSSTTPPQRRGMNSIPEMVKPSTGYWPFILPGSCPNQPEPSQCSSASAGKTFVTQSDIRKGE